MISKVSWVEETVFYLYRLIILFEKKAHFQGFFEEQNKLKISVSFETLIFFESLI